MEVREAARFIVRVTVSMCDHKCASSDCISKRSAVEGFATFVSEVDLEPGRKSASAHPASVHSRQIGMIAEKGNAIASIDVSPGVDNVHFNPQQHVDNRPPPLSLDSLAPPPTIPCSKSPT